MAKVAKQLNVVSRYIYKPETDVCPYCNHSLRPHRHYQWRKTVQQLDKVIYVASQGMECCNPVCSHQAQSYTSGSAQLVSLPGCTYGLDVIAQIGWWRDREHLNRHQIHQRLEEGGLQISERQVDYLYERYQVLLSCKESDQLPRLEQIVEERGGLIISIDGLEPEGGSEQLWLIREVQTETVLAAGWLARVNHKSLGAFLKPVIELNLTILSTLSDKQPCLEKALKEVLPDVPHQWCHSHYLGNARRPVYEQDSALKTQLRKVIRSEVRESLGEVLSGSDIGAFSPSGGDWIGGRQTAGKGGS